jgi:ActR/RegA family two-component response regulator
VKEDESKPVILIAESDPHTLSLLAGTFLLRNFRAYTASSASEAKEVYKVIGNTVDLVLLNGTIAGDEGIGVIVAIRRLNSDQKIVLIADNEGTRINAMKVGCDNSYHEATVGRKSARDGF